MRFRLKLLKELIILVVHNSTHLKMNSYKTNTICKEAYAAPAAEVIEMSSLSVLCESNEDLIEDNGGW